MKYKLTIIKYDKNENYEEEMARWKERDNLYLRRGNYDNTTENSPTTDSVERSLEVFLTEEEYKKVKSEVIKIFE